MSWKTSGQLLTGPPTTTNSRTLDKRFKPNLGGLNAFQREQQYTRYGREEYKVEGWTEWDVLRENHRFVRDDEVAGEVSWEERLARAYESKLFKEFALIDLKHYKSKRLALRWRTAPEVVQGLGEDTCGSLRCKYHETLPTTSSSQVYFNEDGYGAREGGSSRKKTKKVREVELRGFELPFVYVEAGERREALVKVRLCGRCQGKLMWKAGGDGDGQGRGERGGEVEDEDEDDSGDDIDERAGREGDKRVKESGGRSRRDERVKRERIEDTGVDEPGLGASNAGGDTGRRRVKGRDQDRDRHRSRSPRR